MMWKSLWSNVRHYPLLCLGRLRTTMITSVRIAGALTETKGTNKRLHYSSPYNTGFPTLWECTSFLSFLILLDIIFPKIIQAMVSMYKQGCKVQTHWTYMKFTLEEAMKAQRGSRCIALLFLQTRRQMGVGGQCHAPATLHPGKTWYPLYWRPGGPQGRSGWVQKILPSLGFDPRTVQPIASRYTNYAHFLNTLKCSWRCNDW
jgi:hypothetical protein